MSVTIVRCESGWLVSLRNASHCSGKEWAFTTASEMITWLAKNLDKITKPK